MSIKKCNYIVLVELIFILLFLCGCTIAPSLSNNGLLFLDDFSHTGKGWDIWEKEDGSTINYYEDGLVFIINSANYDYVSTPRGEFGDVRVETVVKKLTGPDDNTFGLVCRFQDEHNYYAFLISSDGYYGILRVKAQQYHLLTGDSMQFSSRVRQGDAPNHLRADCDGKDLTFYINEYELTNVSDDSFPSGGIGLTAGIYDAPGVVIWFDNFVALTP